MTTPGRSRRRLRPDWDAGSRIGLAPRLFLSDFLVIITGAGTLLVVALWFAPAVFHAHLRQAQLPVISREIRDHVDSAFDQALLISLGMGVALATIAAVAISWLAARRLAAPVLEVAHAARRLADGHYQTQVPDPRLGPEFSSLADSMNRLSRRLATTEADRRRLTADLAHQLRTPLASVQATVEALLDGVLAPDHEALTVLADQATRLHRLVGDLEKVSRADERQLILHPTAQSLAPVVTRVTAAVQDWYRAKGVTLTVEVDPAAPMVRIDPGRIGEALSNLLDNALRHTPSGGRVTVTLASMPRPGRPTAVLTIRDSGEGFTPDQAERLFERFHRGQGVIASSGSGLGLTIARALVEAHGGTLDAHSDGPGHGAALTMTLPAR